MQSGLPTRMLVSGTINTLSSSDILSAFGQNRRMCSEPGTRADAEGFRYHLRKGIKDQRLSIDLCC